MKKFAIFLAKTAGQKLLKAFGKEPVLHRAHLKDIHTIHDLRSDRYLISKIKKRYPDHSILTEESGFLPGKAPFSWIVDPLDGSSNFVHHNPFFSVSIAVADEIGLYLGVIYAPMPNELFVAERDKGAYLNGRPILVSNVAKLSRAYLVCCEGEERSRERFAKIHKIFIPKTIEFRKLGSAALECAWVASGRADGYVTTKIAPWDVAAGILLIQEAGGQVTDFKGNPWSGKTSDLIASNGKIHKQLLRHIKRL